MKGWILVAALACSSAAFANTPSELVGRWGAFGEELWVLNPDGSGTSDAAHASFRWSVQGDTLNLKLKDGEVRQVRYTRVGQHLILDTGAQRLYAVKLAAR